MTLKEARRRDRSKSPLNPIAPTLMDSTAKASFGL